MSRAEDDRGIAAWSLRTAIAGALALVAAGVLAEQARSAIETQGKGLDFAPLRAAASALLHGASIYSAHRFVYPPTAAFALLPLTLGSFRGALDVWLVLSALAVALAAALALRPWRGGWWPAVAALGACALLKSDTLTDTLWLGNLTLLLAPVAVLVLLAFDAERWRAGLALLVLSLLVKPLLAPLLLVPLLRGRWLPLAQAVLGGIAVLALAIALAPGGGHFFSVIGYLEGGSSLRGSHAVYNVSLHGLGERLAIGGWATTARIAVAAATIAATARWTRRPSEPGASAALGTLLLLAFMLAGSLSENHYLLVAAACTLAMLGERRDALATLLALPGLALVIAPRHWLGGAAGSLGALQVRWVVAELLLGAAAFAAVCVPAGAGAARNRGWPHARARAASSHPIVP